MRFKDPSKMKPNRAADTHKKFQFKHPQHFLLFHLIFLKAPNLNLNFSSNTGRIKRKRSLISQSVFAYWEKIKTRNLSGLSVVCQLALPQKTRLKSGAS